MLVSWLCTAAVAFVALLAGFGAVVVNRSSARALVALSAQSCPQCKAVFSEQRVVEIRAETRQKNQARLAEARAKGDRIRLDLRWHFVCAGCGTPLVFHPETHELKVDGVLPAGSAG